MAPGFTGRQKASWCRQSDALDNVLQRNLGSWYLCHPLIPMVFYNGNGLFLQDNVGPWRPISQLA